jgi:hypothetical protein
MNYISILRSKLATAQRDVWDQQEYCHRASMSSSYDEANALNGLGPLIGRLDEIKTTIRQAEALGWPFAELAMDPPTLELDRGALGELICRYHAHPEGLTKALLEGRACLTFRMEFPTGVVTVDVASEDPAIPSGPWLKWDAVELWTRLQPVSNS